ncbi:hypothetical protein JCM10207_000636 [Rhodosporidiobolus poonsookiae]
MYFPSPLPTTRLSLSTSFLPTGPAPPAKTQVYKTPGRPAKGKFKDSLGGVQEEEGEEILAIVRGPNCDDGKTLWAALGREEVSVWSTRPKVVLAKLRRTPVSLRTHGGNSRATFHGPARLIVTTTTGHHLLYSISPIGAGEATRTRKSGAVYVLPGGEKAREVWPEGPGEGGELEGVVLRGEGERGVALGDGIGCVCATDTDLLVAVQDPPSLRVIPFPSSTRPDPSSTSRLPLINVLPPSSANSSTASLPLPHPASPEKKGHKRRPSAWEGLPAGVSGEGETEVEVLDDWEWLVGRDRESVTITSLTALPSSSSSDPGPAPTPSPLPRSPSGSYFPQLAPSPSARKPTSFILTTSDGRTYLARWAPAPLPPPSSAGTYTPTAPRSPMSPPRSPFSASPLSSVAEHPHPSGSLASELAAATSTLSLLPPFSPSSSSATPAPPRWAWEGVCFHPAPAEGTFEGDVGGEGWVERQERELDRGRGATEAVGVNGGMGLVAVGCEDGTTSLYNLEPFLGQPLPPSQQSSLDGRGGEAVSRPVFSHELNLRQSLNTTASGLVTGRVTCLSWTSDGLTLFAGAHAGFSLWSVYGRLGAWSVAGAGSGGGFEGHGIEGEMGSGFEDHFLGGVRGAFWAPGNLELFVLCPPPVHPKKKPHDEQLFVIPFAKSAVASSHTPDNTRNAFLLLDDRVLVYRGADQPDMSVINPESDVWQHIKIPATYISPHHPITHASISSDARLIAVAGRRGLTHYNALSGRWRLFENEREEEMVRVRGGMAWWGSTLIVGCEVGGQFELRLFSRDRPLSLSDSLETYPLDSEPLLLSVFDSSLLLYTADNTFHHFLIRPTRAAGNGPRLRECGSIGFEGVVKDPRRVRGISWLVPKSQQRFGDPADDLNVATIIFLLSGRLLLLRPRRAATNEVKYDLQVLADRTEFYWTHLRGIGPLENSLWAWDGRRVRVWLDALTIEKVRVDARRDAYETVKESVAVPLDFYPLAVLMDKGIIVGVDQETSLRKSLDFAIFRIITTTHLFLPSILRFHLTRGHLADAVSFASHYQHLVYFAHALEILLHGVLEDEADAAGSSKTVSAGDEKGAGVLPRVIEFLDHFDECLQVVVNCARKTEQTRWEFLFDVVGKPRDLFEKCVEAGFLKVAASYLLVLHNLEPLEQSSKDTIRLLKTAMEAGEWTLCRELLRFLYSLDRSGVILRTALSESDALPPGYASLATAALDHASLDFRRAISSPPSIAATLAQPPLPAGGLPPHPQPHAPPPGRLGGLGMSGLTGRVI